MDFKKKAGLALALAAIFTTGGANLALADNVTNPTTPVTGDEPTVIDFTVDPDTGKTGTVENLTVTENVTFSEDMKDAIVPIKVLNVESSVDLPFKEIEMTDAASHLTLGKADSPATKASLNKVTLGNASAVIDAQGGGSYSMTEIAATAGSTATINITGDTDKNQTTALTVGKLNSAAALKINVGDADGAGQLTVTGIGADAATLTGSVIFADPAWNGTAAVGSEEQLAGSSTVTIAEFKDDTIDGKLAAGRRSFYTVGADTSGWMMDIIRDTGLWGPTATTAAFGLYAPSTLDATNGYIYVNGDIKTASELAAASVTANSVTFADGSLYAVNLDGYGKDSVPATLTVNGTTAINIGTAIAPTSSTLDTTFYGYNPRNGEGYTILEGFKSGTIKVGMTNASGVSDTSAALTWTTIAEANTKFTAALGTNDYWSKENLLFSSDLFTGKWSIVQGATNDTYNLVLTPEYLGAETLAKNMQLLSSGMFGMVDDLLSVKAADLDHNAGTEFFYNLLTSDTISNAEKARFVESAGRAAVAAAVPAISSNVAGKFASLVVDHNNMLNAIQPAYGNEPGKLGLWVNPFYHTSDVDGMDAGKFENAYEMNYGGAAFGIDYNVNEAFRLGLAMNVGGGDSESEGDFSKTENDFDFFGASLYGSYSNGSFGLTGDLGFTGTDSEITQRNYNTTLKGDADSDALTLGLTGQYRFAASDNFNITPHLGLRYTKISVDNVKLKASGAEVMEIATDDQNLFQIPLGVKFSSDIATDGGWTISPSADLGVLFTTGDTDVDSRARIPGRPFSPSITSEAADGAAFTGALGVKAAADNGLSLGLDYGILASGNQTDHQFSGMLRFEF